jgi:hydrogenase maturation protease
MSEMLGHCPQHLLLIGVQPEELEDYGGSLRDSVRARIAPALDIAVDYLAQFGINVIPRQSSEHQPQAEALAHRSVGLHSYEQFRPSESEACRTGDARVLQSARVVFDPKDVTPEPLNLSVDIDKRRQD